jgi:hypothetical protein
MNQFNLNLGIEKNDIGEIFACQSIVSLFCGIYERRDTIKWIPFIDFSVSSADGFGAGAVGDSSNLNLRRRVDRTTFSSAMAKR